MKLIKIMVLLLGVFAISLKYGFCQTNLQFTSIGVTDEGNVRIAWTSISNEIYEIDEADALPTNSGENMTWNLLYGNYPSHGTNTFWLDTGNYNLFPEVLNPKNMPMRFYRIVDLGQDSLIFDEPSVTILSPVTSATVMGELSVTVMATTDQPVLSGTKLYLDGQEMPIADNTTNYTDSTGVTNYEVDTYNINTCEWGNETHVIFATVESESAYGDTVNSGSILIGHGVSSFVPVFFSNLVTRISFSQPSFDPSSGQTQQVTAVFALNSDWTLNIVDINSNIVQTATGSGMSMLYNWDGTSNGTNILNGIFYYYISAATNGGYSDISSDSGNSVNSPLSADFARSSSQSAGFSGICAIAPDSVTVIPLALYPPGFDTNGFTLFEASSSEAAYLPARNASVTYSSSFSANASSSSSSPVSQSAPATPQRPPTNPIKGFAGSFGVCYDTYTGNGANGYTLPPLDNGLHVGLNISMNNYSASSSLHYATLSEYNSEVNNFISQMQHSGWNKGLLKIDNTLSINDLIGSGSPLNNVNLGIFLAHGAYGTSGNGIDYAANRCKQMYYPVTSGSSAQYLRLSQMNLGGNGTNGLKWAALMACNSLQHNNWANMQSLGVKPYNSNLHLLMGVDTVTYTSNTLLYYWAKYMTDGPVNFAGTYNPMTIRNAWYRAARVAYAGGHYANPISFVVAGDTACAGDYLATNNMPGGTWFIDTPVQVWP